MSSTPVTPAKKAGQQHGLAFWMSRVLEECDHVGAGFAADPVHDLRVALRRCRSMADGLMAVDPDPAWKEMKKAGKQLFSSLGDLRDVQVMEEWTGKLGSADDTVTTVLLQVLFDREARHRQQAKDALDRFDRKQWKKWTATLSRQSSRVRSGSLIFRHLALERWTAAYDLHRRAMRSRSQVALHSLRIGIKRFRYIVENFLPEHHKRWIADLKDMQDLLGEIHDLDVLWATALQVNAFPNPESQQRWRTRIREERDCRLEAYRSKAVGEHSLWPVWRAELPQGKQVEAGALARLKLWASFLDPDVGHSAHVAQLALQLYDGLPTPPRSVPHAEGDQPRGILQVAALLHDVGLSKHAKGHHKDSYRLIRKLAPPQGWSVENLHLAGVVARYHRGTLPRAGQKTLAGLDARQRSRVSWLAGILRLANAFDADRSRKIHRLTFSEINGSIVIHALGYNSRDRLAEAIAGSRHLLETVYRRPIMIKTLHPHPHAKKR